MKRVIALLLVILFNFSFWNVFCGDGGNNDNGITEMWQDTHEEMVMENGKQWIVTEGYFEAKARFNAIFYRTDGSLNGNPKHLSFMYSPGGDTTITKVMNVPESSIQMRYWWDNITAQDKDARYIKYPDATVFVYDGMYVDPVEVDYTPAQSGSLNISVPLNYNFVCTFSDDTSPEEYDNPDVKFIADLER